MTGELTLSTPRCPSRASASERRNHVFCFASASRASLSSFQFGAYLTASSYLRSASLVLPCFKSAPGFQGIGPMRSVLVRIIELGRRTVEIPVLGERQPPRVIA